MNNKVYYIKPENNNFEEAVKKGFLKALNIMAQKEFSNIKFVVTGLNQLDAPNYISGGLDLILNNNGEKYTNLLKKDRGFSIPGMPTDEQTTGINLILLNSNPSFTDENTVVLLIWADYESFKKLESILFHTSIELVAVVYNETNILNELLSSTKSINISSGNDANVIPYTNNFSDTINQTLHKLKGINITDIASHNPTRERMRIVIDELKQKQLTISYLDFLGFLVNEVNFPLKESVDLMNWKHRYFNR